MNRAGETIDHTETEDIAETTGELYTTSVPETTSEPETTIVPETADSVETLPVETTPVDTINARIGDGENIAQYLTYHTALAEGGFGSGVDIIYTKAELDRYISNNYNRRYPVDPTATNEIYPRPLYDILDEFDERFFENNQLIIPCGYEYPWTVSEKIVYAYIGEENNINIHCDIKRLGDEPNRDMDPMAVDNTPFWAIVEIPKEIYTPDFGVDKRPSHNWIHFGAFMLPFYLDGERYTVVGLQRLESSVIDSLCQTEAFKEYLIIQKEAHRCYERVGMRDEWDDDRQWINETLEKCK